MIIKNKMILVSEKESFIVRILMKKVTDAGVECTFVPCKIKEINEALADDPLVALYLEDDSRPDKDALRFLAERLNEANRQLIIAGSAEEIGYICDHMPGASFYKTFYRPIDNAVFVETVRDYFVKESAGEFRKSILIVDDDPQYLTLVREWLRNDYKISMANSGMQAITLLAKNKVDLILLDYEMPVTSGAKVLEMLRNDPDTANIPVMFLTGKGDKESVMAVVSLKPEGYFLKSIQKDELLEKLSEFFILHK